MGIVNMGIPRRITLDLARINGSDVFIETGTYLAATARWASKHFNTVHTIELSDSLFEKHGRKLADADNVTPHKGDSRAILPEIIRETGDKRCLFWLDGHWSGGETAGVDDECPLLGELECLAGRKKDIILIDDARLFLGAPPRPHKPSQWPTISEIVSIFFASGYQPFIQIVDDVIFIIPNEPILKEHLVEYAQGRADQIWADYLRCQKHSTSVFRRLVEFFLKMIHWNKR